jgi:hypothetical protein
MGEMIKCWSETGRDHLKELGVNGGKMLEVRLEELGRCTENIYNGILILTCYI